MVNIMLYSPALEGFYRVRVKEEESDHYGSWNSIIRERGLAVSVSVHVSVCVGVLFFSSSWGYNSIATQVHLCNTGFHRLKCFLEAKLFFAI